MNKEISNNKALPIGERLNAAGYYVETYLTPSNTKLFVIVDAQGVKYGIYSPLEALAAFVNKEKPYCLPKEIEGRKRYFRRLWEVKGHIYRLVDSPYKSPP